MNYAEDILKHEAAYYTLTRAKIIDGNLIINARGSATCSITIADLPYLTSTFMFNCIATPYNDRYAPTIKVTLCAKPLNSTDIYVAELYPINAVDNSYTCIFNMPDGEYSEFTLTIFSPVRCLIPLWELHPEALSENIEVIIDGVKQSLPRLLYDYNTYNFIANVYETTVAIITCRLLDNTDIQGHFLATFTATEACTIVVRFYDNNSEELFSPLYYDVSVGYNTIGIPHSFLERKAGIHTFVVSMQAFAGELHFDTRGVLFTIDGGYLAARALTIGMDVLDMAVRQPLFANGPDELWLVGLDEGELLVRKRDYNDTNANIAFLHVASMGKAIAGAIEFNGEWVYRTGSHKYTIETEEEAYIFVVNEDKELYAYHGPFDEEPYLIATDVELVKACKGFSSIEYIEQDQGLVAAYLLSDGSAWYCQYKYDENTQQVHWMYPVKLDDGPWNFINVSRLNDYRLSFQLSNDESNIWMYTERTWVGQATPPEILTLPNGDIDYSMWAGPISADRTVAIDSTSYTSEYNEHENKYLWTVSLHFDHVVIVRSVGSINDYVTVTGEMAPYYLESDFNTETNCIEATFKMDIAPEDAGIISCTFTINAIDGFVVATFDNGYHIIGHFEEYFYIDNAQHYEQNYIEALSLGNDTTLNRLIYKEFQHSEHTLATEHFTLGSDTTYNPLVVETINYEAATIRTEAFILGIDTTLNALSYTGTHIKPV